MTDFDELVDDAASTPIDGWDFGYLDGRAIEERPSWHYFDRVAERAATVASVLELPDGGFETTASRVLVDVRKP